MKILNWTNKLPTSWRMLPLKATGEYFVSSVDKIVNAGETPVELCNYTDVYKNDFISTKIEFMKGSATEEEILKYALKIGDVLITKDSESWDDIGVPALVIETKPNLLCGYHLALIRPNQEIILPAYLFRCIQSKEIRVQLELASTGVTRFGLPKDEIGRLLLPVPPLTEQEQIIKSIQTGTDKIDDFIIAAANSIEILKERRTALISAAVTGQIEMPVA